MQVDDYNLSRFGQKEYDALIKRSEECLVVLIFSAEWLGTSFIIDSNVKSVERNIGRRKAIFFRVETDAKTQYPININMNKLPIIVMLKNQEVVDVVSGIYAKKAIEDRVRKQI